MSAGTTQVWVTYIVHVKLPGERYPVRQCARTDTVDLDTADLARALKRGAGILDRHLKRGAGRGGRRS